MFLIAACAGIIWAGGVKRLNLALGAALIRTRLRHPREGGEPVASAAIFDQCYWIPACARMTVKNQ
jgi:hypothetical protein